MHLRGRRCIFIHVARLHNPALLNIKLRPLKWRAALKDPSLMLSNFGTFWRCLRKEACLPRLTQGLVHGLLWRGQRQDCWPRAQRGGHILISPCLLCFLFCRRFKMADCSRLDTPFLFCLIWDLAKTSTQPIACCRRNFFLTHSYFPVLIQMSANKGKVVAFFFLHWNTEKNLHFSYYSAGIEFEVQLPHQRVGTFLTLNVYCHISPTKGCTGFYSQGCTISFLEKVFYG